MRHIALALCLTLGCSKYRDQSSGGGSSRLGELKSLYAVKLDDAQSLRDAETGWLARHDCDGMIYAAKYAASVGVDDVRIEAAEYPEAGKFGRRPPPWCWTPEAGDQGAKTEWSRDMLVAGLLPWAYLKGRRDVLERHAAFVRAHDWFAGEPVADGRTYYTPQVRGLLLKTIHAMGGADDPGSLWPSIWPAGLTDYEAHLQVMQIWLQGETARVLNDMDAVPARPAAPAELLRISETMFERLEEHAAREPRCPLYLAVLGLYTGELDPAIDALTAEPVCSWVRCLNPQDCELAEWLFAASIVFRKTGTTL